MSQDLLDSIGVFGVIFNDKKQVLLCHRTDKDLWNLPGGGVEEKELPEQALIREIQEEINCACKLIYLTGMYHKIRQQELVYTYLAEIQQIPVLSEEADEIRYFDVDKLPVNTAPKQIQRIIDAYNFESKVFFREQ